jgi:hypothetical protein
MKLFITILLLFTVSVTLGQSEINQKTESGQKIGKWVGFYENGKIKEVNYYELSEKKFTDRADAFFNNYPFNPDSISIVNLQHLISSEIYEYTDSWEFKRIRRKDSTGIVFLYGPNQEIELKKTLNTDFTVKFLQKKHYR